MARKIQHKRGLKVNLPTLDVAELGFATDSKEVFIGTADVNVNVITNNLSTGTTVTQIWSGTQAQYDAIGTKNANTLYFIV